MHCNHSVENAENLIRELRTNALLVRGPLNQREDCKIMRDEIDAHFGHLDAVIHPVGWYDKNLYESNVQTAVSLYEAVKEDLYDSPRGRAVFFGTAGLVRQVFGENAKESAYHKCKLELWKQVREWAREAAGMNTTVNMISPGEMTYSITNRQNLPMGRKVEPMELCSLAEYLLSFHAASVTGQNIEIAGGYAL